MAIDAITGRVFAPVFKDQQTAEVVPPGHPLYDRSEAGLMAWRSSDPNAADGGMPPLHPEYLASHGGSGPDGVPGRVDPRTGEWMEDWSNVTSFWSVDEALMARKPVGIPTADPNATTASSPLTTGTGFDGEGLIADIADSFPWAVELGFMDLIKGLVIDGAGAEQIIAEVRQSSQYQQRFPGMIGPDGIRRYRTEGEYLTAVEGYRGVLQDFGEYDRATDTPMSYVAFMDAGIDANELKDRFGTFRAIQAGSQQLKDAFFVYAGMEVGDEDLYQAVVSPQFREELTNEYDVTVANGTLDYATFIERARQTSTAAVVKTLETLASRNATTGTMVSRIMSMDPVYGRSLIASLFTGGDTAATNRTLSLGELTEAFSAAVMGSAATEAGWAIPTKDRLEEFRAAGIEASTLHTLYESMKLRTPALAGMVSRTGRGSEFGQEMVEQSFLGESRELGYAQSAEAALGARGGGFSATQEGRRFAQRGRSLR
jgi:hypothetical protein